LNASCMGMISPASATIMNVMYPGNVFVCESEVAGWTAAALRNLLLSLSRALRRGRRSC
jgi:hypothetical protein